MPAVADVEQGRAYVKRVYRELFELELGRRCEDASTWPEPRDWEAFERWFELEFVDRVVDMSGAVERKEAGEREGAGQREGAGEPEVIAELVEGFEESQEFEEMAETRSREAERGTVLAWCRRMLRCVVCELEIEPREVGIRELTRLLFRTFPREVAVFGPDRDQAAEAVDALVAFLRFLGRELESDVNLDGSDWLERKRGMVVERFVEEMGNSAKFGDDKRAFWGREGHGEGQPPADPGLGGLEGLVGGIVDDDR